MEDHDVSPRIDAILLVVMKLDVNHAFELGTLRFSTITMLMLVVLLPWKGLLPNNRDKMKGHSTNNSKASEEDQTRQHHSRRYQRLARRVSNLGNATEIYEWIASQAH